jgi:hypothetical protein
MKKTIIQIVAIIILLTLICFLYYQRKEITKQEKPKTESKTDWLGRTNSVKNNQRVFEIEVVDLKTGDTIVLHYTDNSARYTKAYRK